MQLEKIKSIYPTVLLVLALCVGSIYTAHLIVTQGILMGPIVIVGLVGLLMLGLMVKDYKIGLYLMMLIAAFNAWLNRSSGFPVQYGVILDALAGVTFFIMLFTNLGKKDWSVLKSGITYWYTAVVVYQLLQLFNPNAISFIGWLVAFRANTSFLLFFVFVQLFTSFEEIKKFTIFWIGLSVLIALYGIYQEIFGLTSKELAWVYSSPGRADLLIIWGHMRKFSFLSDPSAFGLYMAFSGLATFVLIWGPFPMLYRLFFAGLTAIMFVSMSFSGTRTAIAMVAIGVAFYVLVTLRWNRQSFFVLLFSGLAAVALFFGPFYGGTVQRIRSTFQAEDDASMNVRDKKRIRLQEYVQTHPFGGGLNTTGGNGLRYSPGHALAEGWDPDSGYLLIALEMGWIGLLIGMGLFFTVILKGIDNYFAMDDPLLKTINLAYLIPFLSLSIAHFTQDALFQKPVYLVIIAAYAVMLTLPTFKKTL